MILKNEYKKAKEIVKKYEKQLELSIVQGKTCYILQRTTDNLIFVTTDENYANRFYDSGDYIMLISTLQHG